jgi:glycosyltransferase involved in cell wall biosynthesis
MAIISVLMPVYNVEAYLAEALASIQSQTFSDLEIVLVDDGSTDATLRIAKKFAHEDARIKIVRTPRNLGLPMALNFGLPFCAAPFIARMDGDDVALPDRLEKQFQFIEQNPEISLVGCATSAIDEFGKPISGLGVSRKPITQEAICKTMLLAPPCSHIWLARHELYDALSGYRDITAAEDYDFLLRAISAGFRIGNLAESLMLIRARADNYSWRLEQRKAHHYVVRLYRERLQRGQDSFSREAFAQNVKTGKAENRAFNLAMQCVQRGLRSRSRALLYLFLALSALVSPWQARYFLSRLRLKLALRKQRSSS